MNIYYNLRGTTADRFKVGKGGVTILQGSSDPNTSAVSGSNGDIYVQIGGTQQLFQFKQSTWVPINTDQVFSRTVVNASSFTVNNGHYYLGVNYAGAVTLTLPAGVTNKIFIIKDESGAASTNTITVTAHTGETIDGQSSQTIATNYSSITMVFGTEWHVF
jgi:hypothetical protein